MIVELPDTSARDVAKRLVGLRHEMGAVTLGRVLTLIVVVDESSATEALEVANDATRHSPSRILVLVRDARRGPNRLDAEIRLGGDAGASEIVVLRLFGELAEHGRSVLLPLLLPDSPIVAWWPGAAPDDVAGSPIGALAHRRVTDAAADPKPREALAHRAKTYVEGDTDLAWSRLTRWRSLLAAALDQAPYEPVTAITVTGAADSASADLLAAWLARALRCPVRQARAQAGVGVVSVRLERASGPIDLVRTSPRVATLSQPGQPVRRVNLSRRSPSLVLSEELRRLDRDDIYEVTLLKGMKLLPEHTDTASAAVRAGIAPDIDAARRAGDAARRASSKLGGSAMVEAEPADGDTSTSTVKKAAASRLAKRKAERVKEES